MLPEVYWRDGHIPLERCYLSDSLVLTGGVPVLLGEEVPIWLDAQEALFRPNLFTRALAAQTDQLKEAQDAQSR